jgi:enoyl-CoA hydratase
MARQERTKTIVPPNSPERWGGVDPKPPPHFDEPKDPVLLEYVHGGRTAIITFNRPQAGSTVTTALGVRLSEIIEEIETKVTVRCAIVTGAGQDFCRGADLRERKAMDSEQWLRQRRAFDRTLYTLRNMRRPIFAAVNGRAVGGGSEFAQSCDFIIAAENASFCQPEALVGISAGGGSTWFLPRQLSPGHAMYQLMTGEPVSAQDAYRMGMVVRLCPPAELMNIAQEIAEKIARSGPTALAAAKLAVKQGLGVPMEHGMIINLESHWRSVLHPDRGEGVKAWNEMREPNFKDPDR